MIGMRSDWMSSLIGSAIGALLVCGVVRAEDKPAAKTAEATRPADSPKAPKLPPCPVMDSGEPIDLSVSAFSEDGPVFFCCENCIGKYQADKQKYAAKIAEQRKALADLPRVQVKCPVTNQACDHKRYTEVDGKKVFFADAAAADKFQKDPAKYKVMLNNAYTYQTKCPVTGNPIQPRLSATIAGGRTIYFATADAKKAFLGDPAKYVAALNQQGIRVKPDDAQEEAQE